MSGRNRFRTAALGVSLATMTFLGTVGASTAVADAPAVSQTVEQAADASAGQAAPGAWVDKGMWATLNDCIRTGRSYVDSGEATDYRCIPNRMFHFYFLSVYI
ncbi:hypothetical protein [Streptomyces sp. NPDC054863]